MTRTGMCTRIGTKSRVSNIPFGRRPNPRGFGNGRVAHGWGWTKIAHMVALVCQAQGELLVGTKIYPALKYVLRGQT